MFKIQCGCGHINDFDGKLSVGSEYHRPCKQCGVFFKVSIQPSEIHNNQPLIDGKLDP